jgi:ribosome-binding protein aMBF1 (putative translation factor)
MRRNCDRAFQLGAKVRTAREQQRGWSRAELAKRVGMATSDLARFEAGGALPALPVLDRIADALDMRLSIAFTSAWRP